MLQPTISIILLAIYYQLVRSEEVRSDGVDASQSELHKPARQYQLLIAYRQTTFVFFCNYSLLLVTKASYYWTPLVFLFIIVSQTSRLGLATTFFQLVTVLRFSNRVYYFSLFDENIPGSRISKRQISLYSSSHNTNRVIQLQQNVQTMESK